MDERPDPHDAPSGFPEPPGEDPNDISGDREPHHALNNPARDPDPTEWPDPYDKREDPRDPTDPDGEIGGEEAHPPTNAESTSDPRHAQDDPEGADRWEAPKRENLDQ
jgi:hypothetical protein